MSRTLLEEGDGPGRVWIATCKGDDGETKFEIQIGEKYMQLSPSATEDVRVAMSAYRLLADALNNPRVRRALRRALTT
jgi:hypothetical protein